MKENFSCLELKLEQILVASTVVHRSRWYKRVKVEGIPTFSTRRGRSIDHNITIVVVIKVRRDTQWC